MYIRRNIRNYKDRTYESVLVEESVREGKKIKKRTVANISKLPADIILLIDNALKSKKGDLMVKLSDIEVEKCYDFGYVFLILNLMKSLRIDEVLSKTLSKDVVPLVRLMIIAKLIAQSSKLGTFNWIRREENLSKILRIDKSKFALDDLYHALAAINLRQNKIDKKWVLYHKKKGNQIYLYDITSSYFEGKANELAAFGYNRDGKKGKMQICIGLITDNTGFPLKIEVFTGNTNDSATVENKILQLKNEFGVDDLIFVGDRGMHILYHLNNDISLKDKGIEFITGLTKQEIKNLIQEKTINLGLFDTDLVEVQDGDFRYVLSVNPILEEQEKNYLNYQIDNAKKLIKIVQEAWRDRYFKNRQNQADINNGTKKNSKLKTEFSQKDLDNYKKRVYMILENTKCTTYFEIDKIDTEHFDVKFNEEKYELDMALCGKYVIGSNVSSNKLSKEEIRQEYKHLQGVEHAFRDLKSDNISIRPIYLRKAEHTHGHVQICFWGYAIIKAMEDKIYPFLKEYNLVNKTQLTFNDCIAELKNIKLCEITIGKNVKTIKYPKLNNIQTKLFNLFNLKPDDMTALIY